MRIVFPERIPMVYAMIFAGLLVLLQQVQGTAFVFSVLCALFILVATLTFNLAGGLTRPSGGYVFFYSVLGVLIGLVGKALLGERADSNLLQPNTTMAVFFGGICGMLVAVYVSRRLTRRRALLQNVVPPERMQDATIGCMVAGIGIYLILAIGYQSGSVLSALGQINRFLPLSIILGVTHQIRKSGGTRSLSIPVIIVSLAMFVFYGLFGFSKEGMLTPVLCWGVAAGAQRYRITLPQIVAFGVAATFFLYYLVPYAQDGRNYRSEGGVLNENIHVSFDLLTHLDLVRDRYKATEAFAATQEGSGYFTAQSAFLDRLQMISVDDRLIDVTERGAVFGLTPILVDFENLIPHVFWPNKQTPFYGNAFAHEIGGLAEDDTTTGISFSPSGEAYHLAKWTGVLIVAPLIWILLFVTVDSLCGDVRRSPWGLLVIALFGHVAPEGMLDGAIYTFGFGSLSIIFGALTSAYAMPLLGRLATGSRPGWDPQQLIVRPLPKRVSTLEPSQGTAG